MSGRNDMRFADWLDRLIEEKGLDLDQIIEAEGKSGPNIMPLSVLIAAIKAAPDREQAEIKKMLVRLDFRAAPILPFFKHLARAIAI